MNGQVDLKKVMDYVHKRQSIIATHENVSYLKDQGIDVAVGTASFSGSHTVTISNKPIREKKLL